VRPLSRLRIAALIAALPCTLWLLLPVLSDGAPISSRIEEKRRQVERKKDRERVLTTTIEGYTKRIDVLEGDITTLQARQLRIEADLSRKRAELARLQDELRRERIRLVRLRARLAEARAALADRLVALYKADKPDVVTVILESDGFADMLERAEFMQRVSAQDARIVDRVRTAKAESVAAERRLDRLEIRQRDVTELVARRHQEVVEIKDQLVDRRDEFQSVRSDKRQALVSTRVDRRELESHLVALEKEQAKIQARLASAASGSPSAGSGSPSAGPVRQGSGSFIWPVNGAFTSPFGQRWGRLHAGIDIAAPDGTPIRAADSGTVVLAAWTGGYGNYTCVSHGGALSTCYAHQSRLGTSAGASVSKGQVIGYVGNTGNSFGAHLHFEVRINGSPVDPMGYL
jgi:murein DD-endopeptidase MepM/ murein hydrolase activator NlpD